DPLRQDGEIVEAVIDQQLATGGLESREIRIAAVIEALHHIEPSIVFIEVELLDRPVRWLLRGREQELQSLFSRWCVESRCSVLAEVKNPPVTTVLQIPRTAVFGARKCARTEE